MIDIGATQQQHLNKLFVAVLTSNKQQSVALLILRIDLETKVE